LSAAHQALVGQLYPDLLQRPADAEGLRDWTAALDQGASPAQVALAFAQSAEGRRQHVQSLYQRFLHRTAEPFGREAFTAALAAGQTREQVAAAVAAAPEYYQDRARGSDTGFLSALYQDALHRPVDPTGATAFGQALAGGTTRAQVAEAIFTSAEYWQDLVQHYYQAFLHRAADAGGLMDWVGALQQGTREEQVIAGIVGSAEYAQRLQQPAGGPGVVLSADGPTAVSWKDDVRVATTGTNIPLMGTPTIDGVALAVSDRVLVKDQTTASQNGIYVVAAGPWSRAADASTSDLVTPEMAVRVSEGVVNAHTEWFLTTKNPITLGTTNLLFARLLPWADVKAFGAKGDAKTVSDGAMTMGSATLTCTTSAPFIPSDVGKAVLIQGAGTNLGDALATTISGYIDAMTVTLAAPAGQTVSGVSVAFGTDDTAAVQAALNAAKGIGSEATVYVSPGNYMVGQLNATSSYPLTVQGEGNASVLTFLNVDDGIFASTGGNALVFRRLTFAGTTARTVNVTHPKSFVIDQCDISGATKTVTGYMAAIICVDASDIFITDNNIHDCGQKGVKTKRSYAITSDVLGPMYRWHVRGNTIRSAGSTVQIGAYSINDSEIVNNVIDGGGPSAIWDDAADGYGIMIYGSALGPSARNRIVGNIVNNTAGSGIYVKDSSDTLVSGNVVNSSCMKMYTGALLPAGVAVNSVRVSVLDNVVTGGSEHGIALYQTADSSTVANNVIRSVGQAGIYINGATGRNTIVANIIETTTGRRARMTGSAGVMTMSGGESLTLTTDGVTKTITFAAGDGLYECIYKINQAFAGSGLVPASGGGSSLPGIITLMSTAGGPTISLTASGTALTNLKLAGGSVYGSISHAILSDLPVSGYRIALNKVSSPASGVHPTDGPIGGDGILLLNMSDSEISDNFVTGCALSGRAIILLGGSNNVIARNQAVSNTGTGAGFDIRSANCTLDGNVARSNGAAGILVNTAATGCIVARNSATANGGDGLAIRSSGNFVQGNVLTGNTGNGLTIESGASNNRALDNDCTGNTATPIADSGTNTTRDGNVLMDKSAPRKGTVPLFGGSATVGPNLEYIAGTTKVRLTRSVPSGGLGHLSYGVAGNVITITSSDSTEASSIDWEIVQ
jgi:parallel beta-helix repeat protein